MLAVQPVGLEPSRCLFQPLRTRKSAVSRCTSRLSRETWRSRATGQFSDPGAADLTCARTGPIKIAADLLANKEGEDVFPEVRKKSFYDLFVYLLL